MSRSRNLSKKPVLPAVILAAAVVFLSAGIILFTGVTDIGSPTGETSCAAGTTLTYSDDSVEVTAAIPEEAGLPEDAQLVADSVDSESEEYANAVEIIESQLGDTLGINAEGTKTSYILYDVSLQSGGEKVEPAAGSVTVNMAFAEAIDVGAYGDVLNYEVVHITDDGVAEIVTDYVNVDDNGKIEGFGFTQESFSYVAVVLGSTPISFDEANAIAISSSSSVVKNFDFDIDIITNSGTSTATDIRSGSSYQIYMHIDFNDTVDTTATYSIDISQALQYFDLDTENIPTSADDCDPIYEDNDIVGYWYVDTTTGTLYFVLSELTSTSNVWAEFTLGASASSSITSGSDKETVTIEIGGGTWTGTYLGDQSSISAQKEITDSSINADEGTYTYSVTLTSDGTTVLTSLVDWSSSYLSWSDGTDVKGQLSTITITDASGNILTSGTDYEVSYDTNNGTATITFLNNGLTLTDGQTITLTYTMTYDATDAPTGSITNENKITANYTTNWDNNTSTSATTQDVQIVNHGTVTKDGVASADYDEVTWTITVNAGDNGYLDDYTLEDSGASGMELELVDADSVAGTSANYSVVITYVDSNSGETKTYTLSDEEAKALIKALNNGTTSELSTYVPGITNISSVVITYVTKDDGTHGNTTYTSTNTVDLIDGGTSVNEGKDSVPGLGNHEDRGEITKELTGTTDTTASWTSTITIYPGATLDYYKDEVNYNGWLSSGHRVEEDSLNLTITVDGVELDSSLYTVTFDSLSGFTVDFDPDIVNTAAAGGDDVVVVLTYTTVFDSVSDSGTYLYNHGKAYFTDDSKEASDSTTLHNYLSKTETSYSNEDGSITWTLSINLAEIAKDYYILYTDEKGNPKTNASGDYYGYWGTLPESILVTDYLPEGMTITSLSYYVASYDWIENGGGKQTYNSDGSIKYEGTIAGFSGLTYKLSDDGTYFTVDLASLLSYLTNFYQWNPYVLTSSNGAIVELTYTTTVTDYAEYLTYSKKTYTNSAEISIGGSLLASDSESYTLNPESKLEKTHTVDSYVQGVSSGSNYITFTVSNIATLVSDYVNSESLKGTTWESVTFVDVYGSDLAYDAGENFGFQIALSSSSVSVSNSNYSYDTNDHSIIYYTFVLSDSTTIEVTVSATEATHTINFTMSASNAQLIDSISYKLRTQTSSGETTSNYDETNSIYMMGYKETETTDQVTEQISWSGASAGSTGGTLHLVKTDLYDSDTVLGGAEFSLYKVTYNSSGSTIAEKFVYEETKDLVATATTLENTGTWTFTGLKIDTLYALVETKAPDGYTADETVYYIYFCEDTTSALAQELTALGVHCYTLTSTNSDGKLTVTNTKDNTTSVSVNKQWLTYTGTDVTSSTSDPEYVQVRLIRKAVAYGSSSGTSGDDDSEVTVTVYEGSYWDTSKTEKYSKTVSDGEDVTITITASMTENSTWGGIYAGYIYLEGGTSISGYTSTGGTPSDYNLGTTATLTYTIPSSLLTGNIEVYYTISSNMSLIEDGISITQASDNPSAGTQTDDPMATTVIGTYYLRASNNWSRTISDLPLYATTTDTKGNTVYLCEYYYYFEELTTLDDYTTTYSDNNTNGVNEKTDVVTITNQAGVEKTNFSVKKTWSDDSGDNQSAVTVEIYKASDVDNGTVKSGASAVETLVLSKDNNWTATVTDLDKYESDGKTEIKYVAVEVTSVTGYIVSYSSNNTDGINEGTIEITNTANVGSLKITKTTTSSDNNATTPLTTEFTVKSEDGSYKETFTYADFASDGTLTIKNLALGKYTVTEDADSAQVKSYTLEVTDNGAAATVTTGGTAEVEITNKYTAYGSLKITKTTTSSDNNAATPKTTKFTVKSEDGSYEKTFTYADFESDGTLTIKNLALGKYTVTEDTDTAQVTSYTLEVTDNGAEATVTTGGTAEVEITNKYTAYGSLKITKTTTSSDNNAATPKTTKFTVKSEDGSYEKTFTYADFASDGTLTIKNLALGKYTVTEDTDTAQVTSYTLEVTDNGAEATVTTGGTAEVEITNKYTAYGSLKITKTTTSSDSSAETPKATKFTVESENGSYKETFTYADFDSDGTLTIKNLALGKYTVTEDTDTAQVTSYTLEVTDNGAEATVKKGSTAEVEITNKYTAYGSLKITKTTTSSDGEAATPKTTKFTVESENGSYKETFTYADFDSDGTLTIKNLALGKYTVTEDTDTAQVTSYTLEVTDNGAEATVEKGSTAEVEITNKYTAYGSLKITKTTTSSDGEAATPQTTKFTVESENGSYKETFTYADFATDGTLTIKNLALGKYTVTEDADTAQITNYTLEVTDNGAAATVEKGSIAEVEITNKYTAYGSLKITKTTTSSDGEAATPQTTKFTVESENGSYEETFTYADFATDGTLTIENLALGEYTVTEDTDTSQVTSYTLKVTDNGAAATVEKGSTATVEITNEYTAYGSLKITKTTTSSDGEAATPKTTKFTVKSKDGNYEETFTYADFASDGTLTIGNLALGEYTVTEDTDTAQVTSYTLKVTDNGAAATVEKGSIAEVEITNKYTSETIPISGSKTWDDNGNSDDKRPSSITIRLLANGSQVASKVVTEAENWEWDFGELPKYSNGVEIEYTITEDAVSNYSSTVSGYDVTNSYTPGKTSVSVTKVWDDSDNQDGIRPTSVTVILVANDVETTQKVTLSKDNNWTATFKDLDEYSNGTKIVYTVKEETVTGYTTSITGSASEGYKITNSHTPEKVGVGVSKSWNDNNNQDGIRPESVTVVLVKNGVATTQELVLSESNNWSDSFTGLDKYTGGVENTYTVEEKTVTGYTTSITGSVSGGYKITNTHTPETIEVSGTKTWDDNGDNDGKRPNSITINLMADGIEVASKTVTAADNWEYTFTDLAKYANGKAIVYSIIEEAVENYSASYDNNFNVKNTYTPGKTSISVTKAWDDNDDQDGKRPESVQVVLLKNGKETGDTRTLSEDNNWTCSFTNLDEYTNGVLNTYTIEEITVADYVSVITESSSGVYVITNTHETETIDISGTKTWVDNNNQDGKRPSSIKISLLANGVVIKTKTVTAEDNWTYTFTGLDKYKDGKAITYTIEEDAVEGYTTTYEGYNITNSYTTSEISVSGTKTWDDNGDNDGKRPSSITINLLADGVKVDSKTVTAADNWAYTFTNLAKYSNGKEIVYTISEDKVTDYSATYNGYNVTNSYTPGKTSISVTKAWEDANDQDGKRPESVTVVLLKNGVATGDKLSLSADNNWIGSFTNLDEYTDGVANVYTIEEVSVEGYTSVISGDAEIGYVITNTYTPETVEVSGTKTWDDSDDQDGKRPTSITISLLANGDVVQTKNVTLADNWSYTFTDLAKYADGKEIVYSITEDTVEDYSTTYDGYNITNSYTPGKTSISVTKAWYDTDDQDGIRPDSITVVLVKNGVAMDQTLILNADNNWTDSFTNLDEYTDGELNEYTVQEVSVEGYTSVITGDAETGYIITNTHEAETVEISGVKTWLDSDDKEGLRPDSITINLLADGVVVDSKVVTADDDWTYTFTGLAKCVNGVEIEYTITEDAVYSYATSYDGYNVVNTLETTDTETGEQTNPDTEDETDSIDVETEESEEYPEESEEDDTDYEEYEEEDTEDTPETETENDDSETGNKKTGDVSSLQTLFWMALAALGVTCIYTADRRRKTKR